MSTAQRSDTKYVAITGSSGVIGTALVAGLRSAGHRVVRLVRREPTATDEVRWYPERGGRVDPDLVEALEGVDAAVNLAGAGVGDKRWTASYKRELMASRVDATTALVSALGALDPVPGVLVSGSAYGYYGDTGDREADERAPMGRTYLARVAAAWEEAATPAVEVGIRLAYARTGLVVSPEGGAFGRMRQLVTLGVGGPLGGGAQWWSYISLRDEVRAITWLLSTPAATGAYNLTAPHPTTNAEATVALGRLLGRPTLVPVPSFAVRIALGEFADEILDNRRVVPTRLLAEGFDFLDPTIEQALAHLAD